MEAGGGGMLGRVGGPFQRPQFPPPPEEAGVLEHYSNSGLMNDTSTPRRSRPAAAQPPPSSILPPRGPAINIPANFLQKNTLEYVFCVIVVFSAVMYFGAYETTLVCREHYEELKMNLRPPWGIYRLLGSKGIDITDMQWYFFVVALPPALPVLILYLFLSRRLRRSAPTVTTLYTTSRSDRQQFAPAQQQQQLSSNLSSDENMQLQGRKLSSFSTGGMGTPLVPVAGTATVEVDTDAAVATKQVASSFSNDPSSRVFIGRNLAGLHWLHIIFGATIALGLNGPGFLFGVVLMLINYFGISQMRKVAPFNVCMTVMWVWHIVMLFVNFHAGGYKFAWFGLSFLDNLWHPMIRWTVHYNMTVLRLIAFNNDYWEALSHGEETRSRALNKHARTCTVCAVIRDQNRGTAQTAEALTCYKCRTECSRPVSEYNLLSYFGYLFYPPLFVAGPMASLNAYISFLHHPCRSVSKKALIRYSCRFLFNAFFLVTMMHYWHVCAMLLTKPVTQEQDLAVGAIKEEEGTVGNTTSTASALVVPVIETLQLHNRAVMMFLTLAFLWSKFNVIWKFFRLFALFDGIDPPEDMPRCFANTVNIQGFWRDWHASFNLWIVRYMYIPMGGNQRKFLSIFPIFFFIAIWHDIELRLLVWAMFICVCFIPEIAITAFFGSKNNRCVVNLKKSKWWRLLRVVGCQLGMMELIFANQIGFSIGTNGTSEGLKKIFSNMSLRFYCTTSFLFFCSANIAIQDRDEKAYEQKVLKAKYDLQ